jgi:hypothetical protein
MAAVHLPRRWEPRVWSAKGRVIDLLVQVLRATRRFSGQYHRRAFLGCTPCSVTARLRTIVDETSASQYTRTPVMPPVDPCPPGFSLPTPN